MNDQTVNTDNAKPKPVLPDAQTVTSVTHYTDTLFAFRTTRPRSLRFRSGEFVMIGLLGDNGKPILRAYSIASPSWDEELEFYSIKVPDGPLTSKLQKIQVGDEVILRPKPVGTLVLDALLPAKRVFLVGTGTGIAPFASLLRDPELYEKYDEIIVTHTSREAGELTYGRELVEGLAEDPLIGEEAHKVKYWASATREDGEINKGRITDAITSGRLFDDLNIPALNPDDRVMICGSLAVNKDMSKICEDAGLVEGANSEPGGFVVEKAFVG